MFYLQSTVRKDYPGLVLETRVHTQAQETADRAKQLSRERAVAVVQYIGSKGIVVKQLRARAFGSTQPLVNDGTEAARRQNNRVVLRVL